MFHNNINKDETCFRSNNIHLSNKGTRRLVANLKSHLRGQANGRRGPETKRNQLRQLRQNNRSNKHAEEFPARFLKNASIYTDNLYIDIYTYQLEEAPEINKEETSIK